MSTTNVSLISTDLRTTHHRIAKGFAYLQNHATNAVLFERGRGRLLEIATREYLPALTTMLATHDRETITAQLAHVEGRLERGSAILTEPVEVWVEDAYIELIHEYEILFDALQIGQYPDTFLKRACDRMDSVRKVAA